MKNLHPLHINPLAILKTSNSKSNPNYLNKTERQIILFQSSKKGRLPNSSCHLPKSVTPWGRLATRKTNTLGRQKAKQHLKSDLENVLNERWHGKMTSPWCGQTKNSNTELSTFLRGWGTKHCCKWNLVQEVKIPKIKLYQEIKVDVRCFSEVEEGNAEQFWCSSSPCRRPTYPPPPMYVHPAHHIFHPFSRHFYCHIFMGACPRLMHRPSMCSLTYSTQGVTELSSYSNALDM